MSTYLELSYISKSFPTPKGGVYAVLEKFDLKIAKSEFVSLIGHSGCGKSTVLAIAAGLLDIEAGGVILDNKQVTDPGPDRAVVFQSPSLFPWMTAMENVMLGVKNVFPQMNPKERKELCGYYLAKVGLEDSFNQKAANMSAGMKQRVGIARAFALRPKLLLLDEPFGMLDSLTRAELQEALLEIWHTEKITALMVTHDVDEALFLSDRIVMMTSGPRARVGDILSLPFPRPRHKYEIMEHPEYYPKRAHLIDFLEAGEKLRPLCPLIS